MFSTLRRYLPRKRGIVFLGITILILLLGLIVWILTTKDSPDTAKNRPPAASPYLESVSEEPIAANYKWPGKPDEPKYISLPTIDTEGFVENVGLTKNQEIQVPSNIHIVGWFNQSAKPGQPGVSVIDGHVDGTTKPGIFRRLSELKQGDQFTVRLGDESIKTYRVISVETVETAAALSVLFSQSPHVTSQLNLITCTGTFNKQSKTYDKRVVASAAFVNAGD